MDNSFYRQQEINEEPEAEPSYVDTGIAEEIYEEPKAQKTTRKRPPFWLGLLIGFAAAFLLFAVIYAGVASLRSHLSSSRNNTEDYEDKINTILEYIDTFYMNEFDKDKLDDALADGLLSNLGDKYAQYYDVDEFDALMESSKGEYAGVGVSIFMNEFGQIEVYKVFRDSPAKEADIHVKDIIVEAAGQRDFETTDALVALVRGTPGTSVDLVIDRDGELIEMSVERRMVKMDTVEFEMLDNNIGYIYISEFDTVTTEQFLEALDELEAQKMTSLIMDLRDNPGGDYDTVVAMCDRVLPKGPIITTEDKNGGIETEFSDEENKLTLPMAVLINGYSASAAEVFTAAIQDYKLATIIGEQSYGKGVVQSIFRMPDGTGMKFTTMNYYTPSGRSIDGVGITPDIVVTIPDEAYEDGEITREEDTQLLKAIEVLSSDQTLHVVESGRSAN